MNNRYDIICIGAGVSGLYLANKMMTDNPNKSMLIIDKLDRVGGSLTSVPLEGVEYEAEGGSNRYLPNQPLTIDAMADMGMTATEVGYSAQSTSNSNLLQTLARRGTQPDDQSITNLDGFINWPSIKRGSYENTTTVDALSGFGFGTNIGSMKVALDKTLQAIPNSVQYFPNGGFKLFAQRMADALDNKYPIMLGVEALELNPLSNGSYKYELVTTAGTFRCNHIVYTGDRHNLNLIGGSSLALRNLKSILYDLTGTDLTNLKMYFTVAHPWWTKSQIGHVVNSDGPIDQIYYASPNSFFIYNDSVNADLLYYLVPQVFRKSGIDDINWIPAIQTPILYEFVKKYLIEMIAQVDDNPRVNSIVRNVKFTNMAFKYTPQASFLYAPTDLPLETLTSILNGYENIHLVSDSYYQNTGWIENAFECVLRAYSSIVDN